VAGGWKLDTGPITRHPLPIAKEENTPCPLNPD